MADRWDDRSRSDWRDMRDYDRPRDRDDRGTMGRVGDEVRSWFGDEDAARRRRLDEARDDRYDRDRDWSDRTRYGGERGWNRATETVRDMTDRDRDGRRGVAEWTDHDRGWDRSRDTSSSYSRGAAWPTPSMSGRGAETYSTREWTPSESTRDWPAQSYAGRGPRGYQRADARIFEEVCDRLTEDHRVDASDIEVQVNGGEVTLAGSVRSREEKRYAEDLAERISGVREVNNNLKVQRPDQVLGSARSGASVLGLTDTPPPAPTKK